MQPVDIWSPIAQGAGLGMRLAEQRFDMGRAMTMDAVALQEARDRQRLVQQQIDEGLREQGYQHAARQFNKNQFRQLMGAGLLPQAQGPGPYDVGAAGGPISMDAAQDDANGQLEQLFEQLDPRQQNLFLEGASRYQQEFRNREMTLSQLESVYGQRDREVQSARGVVGNEAADQALQRNRLFRESATAQVFGVGSGARAQILRGTMPDMGQNAQGDISDQDLELLARDLASASGLVKGTPEYDNAVRGFVAQRRLNGRIAANSIGSMTREQQRSNAAMDRLQFREQSKAIGDRLSFKRQERTRLVNQFNTQINNNPAFLATDEGKNLNARIVRLGQDIDEDETMQQALISGTQSQPPTRGSGGTDPQSTTGINPPQSTSPDAVTLLKQARDALTAMGITPDNSPTYKQQLQAKFRELKGGSSAP